LHGYYTVLSGITGRSDSAMYKLKTAILIVLLLTAYVSPAEDIPGWERFKNHFISKDGRITDPIGDLISSSEGQGYAMLIAVDQDDRHAFDLIWTWTRDNLQVRQTDKLFAWKWGERIPGVWDVIDLNNATDGDTIIAMALIQAAQQWARDDYRKEASRIIESIRTKLIVEKWGKHFVLPAYYGFMEEESLILNPSYFIFPAYRKFASQAHQDFWQIVYRDSLHILTSSAFSKVRLPADWVIWRAVGPEIHTSKSELFGYEAIRTILYLAWDHNVGSLPGIRGYLDFVERLGYVPCCINLHKNSVSLDDASGGFYAVLARAAEEAGKKEQSNKLWEKAGEKIIYEKDDYYSNILYLLSKIYLNQ
jgi:endoglucanase